MGDVFNPFLNYDRATNVLCRGTPSLNYLLERTEGSITISGFLELIHDPNTYGPDEPWSERAAGMVGYEAASGQSGRTLRFYEQVNEFVFLEPATKESLNDCRSKLERIVREKIKTIREVTGRIVLSGIAHPPYAGMQELEKSLCEN